MNIPDDRKYTKEHEWSRFESDGVARIGITYFAQDQLGDVVFIEFPALGTRVQQAAKLGEIESVKAVSDLYSPLTGKVIEINPSVQKSPELVNSDPYGEGWLVRIKIENAQEIENLLDSNQYAELTQIQ